MGTVSLSDGVTLPVPATNNGTVTSLNMPVQFNVANNTSNIVVTLNNPTGTGNFVLDNAPTITNPAITGNITATGNVNAATGNVTRLNIGALSFYQSPPQTITAGANIVLTHGLTGAPNFVGVQLQNISAELNYAVNQNVPITVGQRSSAAADPYGVSMTLNPANIRIQYGSGALVIGKLLDFATGDSADPDPTKWKAIITALKVG